MPKSKRKFKRKAGRMKRLLELLVKEGVLGYAKATGTLSRMVIRRRYIISPKAVKRHEKLWNPLSPRQQGTGRRQKRNFDIIDGVRHPVAKRYR